MKASNLRALPLVVLFLSLVCVAVLGQPQGKGNNEKQAKGKENNGKQSQGKGNNGNAKGPPKPLMDLAADIPPQFVNIEEKRKNPQGGPKGSFPAAIELKFPVGHQDVTLNLTWNRHVTDDVPIVIGSGKGKKFMKRWKSKGKAFGIYNDPKTGASVLVKKNKKNKEALDYAGSFYIGADEYVMEPTDYETSPQGAAPINQDPKKGNKHMIFKKKEQPQTEEYGTDERASLPPVGYTETQWTTRGEDIPVAITGQANYGVQSLVVVDFALFEKYFLASPYESAEDKKDDAIENIRFVLTHVMNGVDMRYRSISDPEFKMYVALSGFYIATTRAAAPFTAEYLTADGYIDSYGAIEGLIQWLSQNGGTLPPYDQATLYTSNYLISPSSGNRILGLAKISALCTPYAVSLNRLQSLYAATQTGAHEMGHNAGGLHDGSDNSCDTYDQYIMATNPITLTDDIYKNAFTFSSCTVDEFRYYLNSLNRDNNNCLLDVAVHGDDDITSILSNLPGDRYTPDEQCQAIFGQESFFCGGASYEKFICRTMECFDTELRYCRATAEMRAATGTSCGNKKWCMEGDCVYDDDAKSGPDYCIYGDYDGPYKNGLTCAIIREQQPFHCYSDYYLQDCCESCAQIRQTANPGCEYGDKDATCSEPNIDCADPVIQEKCCSTCDQPTSDCTNTEPWCPDYIDRNSACYYEGDRCCASCEKYETGIDGCEYGDRSSWCGGVIDQPNKCYGQDDTCCLSCIQYHTGIKGCEYGDRDGCSSFVTAMDCYEDEEVCCETCRGLVVSDDENCRYGDKQTYCGNIARHECYQEASTCCYQCAQHYTGTQDCEYGDRIPGCTLSDCEDPGLADSCCATCQGFHNTPDPTCFDDADWCDLLHPLFCYRDEKYICCDHCAKHYTGIPGCEYGDQHSWCDEIYCQSSTLRAECCTTCATTTGGTTTTTTTSPAPTTTSTTTTTTTTTTTAPTTTTRKSTEPFRTCTVDDQFWCDSDNRIWPLECKSYDVDGFCCHTCQNYYSGDPDCPYGDEAGWCSDFVSESQCQDADMLDNCCGSCKPFLDGGDDGSGVGQNFPILFDHAWWCPDMDINFCYDYSTRETCAKTCADNWQDVPGCEYGDHDFWCPDIDLYIQCPMYKDSCCVTCQ